MPTLANSEGFNLVDDKTFDLLLIETFTIQSYTATADGMGGYTHTWADGDTFDGRLSILVKSDRWSAESIKDDKITVLLSHKIYCDASVVIAADDRVKLGSRYFDVKLIQEPSNLDEHLEIGVLEVNP